MIKVIFVSLLSLIIGYSVSNTLIMESISERSLSFIEYLFISLISVSLYVFGSRVLTRKPEVNEPES
jgi:flagellar biosynthesis protein FliQ